MTAYTQIHCIKFLVFTLRLKSIFPLTLFIAQSHGCYILSLPVVLLFVSLY